ncbi:MAG TPA: hypothetical protein VLE73_02555 [Candidatus Saccharimonadales bacterium]|nr:hypothetical protein [Candidatus Saccharimonadales bacterium]
MQAISVTNRAFSEVGVLLSDDIRVLALDAGRQQSERAKRCVRRVLQRLGWVYMQDDA